MAIIASRTPMVTPINSILPPEESDGFIAVVDSNGIRARAWTEIKISVFCANICKLVKKKPANTLFLQVHGCR